MIKNFEQAKAWPRQIDQIIEAYASVSPSFSYREIWANAVGLLSRSH